MSDSLARENAMPGSALAITRSDHVAIRVPGFDESVDWYRERLGFEETGRWEAPSHLGDGVRIAYLELNGVKLEVIGGGSPERLSRPPESLREEISTVGYSHVCFEVDDIEAVVAELEQRGVEVFVGPTMNATRNRKSAHFKDNSGIPIELVQYL